MIDTDEFINADIDVILERYQGFMTKDQWVSAREEIKALVDRSIRNRLALSGSPQVEAGREPRGCPTPGACSCPREQEGGEAPVAWAVYTPEGKMLLLSASKETTEAYPQYGHRVVPLFAHPPLPADGWKEGASVRVEHDGFQGTIIGRYRRLDGYEGAVMQQDGTKVVHVYGLRHLLPTPPASTEGQS